MHSFKSLVTNTLVVGVGAIATMAVGMALKILLVRALSVEDFGVLVSAQVMVGFVVVAAGLCIPDAVVWLSSRDLERSGSAGPSIAAGAVLGLATGCVASLVLALVMWLMDRSHQVAGLGPAVMWLGLMVPLNIVGDTTAGGLRAVGALWPKVVALDFGRPAVSLIGAGLLLAFGKLSLLSMVAVIVLASALTGAVPILLAWRGAATRPAWSGEAGRMRALLKFGLPLVAAGLLAGPIINNVIPAMLALTVSPQDVAMYSASLALQVLVYMPTAAVEVAILPSWSSSGGPSRHAFQTVTRWALLLSSVPFAILWLAPAAVLYLAYGPRYAGAGLLVQITALSALFAASVGPNEAALKASADTRGILLVRLISAACGLATASVLMSRSGALGAVVGFAIASLMLNALYAVRLWRRQRVQPLSSKYLRALIAIAVALLGTRFVLSRVGGGIAVTFVTAAAAYPCILLVLLVLLGAEEPKLVMNGLKALLRRRVAMSTQ